MKQMTYAGRNVLNAESVKLGIISRSTARDDPAEIHQWLCNHWYRYLIGNFVTAEPDLQRVHNTAQGKTLLNTETLADWVAPAIESGEVWWLNPAATEAIDLEQTIVEFLGSRVGTALEGKLSRINCMQALAEWRKEHVQLQAKAALDWREHRPDAVELLLQTEHGGFYELRPTSADLRHEMAYESQMMRHCLGQFQNKRQLTGGYGEHYASACEAGKIRLFSYRSGQHKPKITIAASVTKSGALKIDQIKGKQNRPPVDRYRDALLAFLNTLDTAAGTPNDALTMDIVKLRSRWTHVTTLNEEEQLEAVARAPSLLRQMPYPTMSSQWLVAGLNPELVKEMPIASRLK